MPDPENDVPTTTEAETVPFGQKLFDSPFVLLLIGIAVMVISFTAWGLWEISRLTTAPLP